MQRVAFLLQEVSFFYTITMRNVLSPCIGCGLKHSRFSLNLPISHPPFIPGWVFVSVDKCVNKSYFYFLRNGRTTP
jgi:hypothetical protein